MKTKNPSFDRLFPVISIEKMWKPFVLPVIPVYFDEILKKWKIKQITKTIEQSLTSKKTTDFDEYLEKFGRK